MFHSKQKMGNVNVHSLGVLGISLAAGRDILSRTYEASFSASYYHCHYS